MHRLISKYFVSLVTIPASHVADSGAQYRPYGWFCIGNAIIFYVAYQCTFTQYDNLWLRLGCIGLAAILIAHARWPKNFERFLPLYWYVTVLLTLPTFFTYMLIMNHFTPVWVGTTIAVIFFIHMLMNFASALFLLAIGSFLGLLSAVCVLYVTAPQAVLFPSTFEYFGFFLLYLVANVIVAIFSYNRQKIEQCRRAMIRAEAESEEKSEFIANMSHDLRTSLTGIKSVAEHALSQISPQHSMYTSWQMVNQSSQQLYDFFESIVLTAKFGLTQTLEPESFCVKTTINNVVTLLKPAFQQKQLQYHVSPQNFEPLPLLRGHPVLIQRILLNLLNNAVKFTEAHGEVIITFELTRDNDDDTPPRLILSVIDTGIGIAKEHKMIIFQAFRRVIPAFKQSSYQGSGLGLHMVKKMLALLNGEIFLTSEVGQGSTFTCCIPVEIECDSVEAAIKENESDVVGKEVQTAATLSSTCATKEILLVEDNRVARRALKMHLQSLVADYSVDEAGTVKEALNLANIKDYALILMDIGLPDGSGYQAAKKIRMVETSKNKTTPIVAVTAHIDDAGKHVCLENNLIQDVMNKPLSSDDVLYLVEEYIHFSHLSIVPYEQASK